MIHNMPYKRISFNVLPTTITCESSSGFFYCLINTTMNETIVNAIIIDGNTYNVLPNGVKCPNCAVKDYCLKGKLGSAVTFDCASIHLEIAS